MPLARRFAWATAARLVLITVLLIGIVIVNVRSPEEASFTVVVGLWVLALAYALSAVYAWFLHKRLYLRSLVNVQLILDQAIWSVLVYLSGGVTSGATSFYGVTCFIGAILAGFRGATLAALSAAGFYIGLVIALSQGWLLSPPDQPAEVYSLGFEETLYGAGLNLLVLVLVALLAGNLAERLRAAGGEVLRAEARADQAEREASLGRLAAGLAHEIRNPLGSIAGSIRLLSMNEQLSEEDQQLCDIIYTESRRLDDLVSDMLNLAKPRRAELVTVDVSSTAREVVELASRSGRGVDDVAVRFQGLESCRVPADEALLRQMLWNLVRNAVQASEASSEVSVVVREAEDDLFVGVVDHGPGLSDEAKQHIYDAFFTTRSKGTGIGLAVVKRIVDEHDWQIDVADTEGGGATFWVNMGQPDSRPAGSGAPGEAWTLFPKAR